MIDTDAWRRAREGHDACARACDELSKAISCATTHAERSRLIALSERIEAQRDRFAAEADRKRGNVSAPVRR